MKENLPKVSVMIPTYNQEDYIAQAIDSVLMQDYGNIEIIIADDCSTDRTGEIAKQYISSKVKYIRNERNLGRVANYRNTLYSHTTGDWIVNLDGDDYYTDKTFISRAINEILSQNDIVCFFGNKKFPSQLMKYHQFKISDHSYFLPGKFYLKRYSEIGAFAHLATLYRRDLAIADGLCYTFNGIQSDFHGIVRLSVYGNVILSCEKDSYQWRRHKGNATNSFVDFKQKYIQGRRCQYAIMRDIGSYFSEEEKQIWLKASRKNVRRMYVMDNLRFNHSFYSLKIGISNFQLNKGYIFLYFKAFFATFFKIDLFK